MKHKTRIQQHITHHKVKGKLVPNMETVKLPEVKNKAGEVIRKAMTFERELVKQITHTRDYQR